MKLTKKSIKKGTTTLLIGMGVLLTATGALTACSGTELNELAGNTGNEAWQNDPDALRISATVGSAFGGNGISATASSTTATAGSGNSASTRSNPMGDMTNIADNIKGNQTAFRLGDKIGVTAEGQGTVIYTLKGDDLASATWTPEDGKYLKWTGETMNVSAYYPVNDNANNGGVPNSEQNFTLPYDQSSASKIAAADYMTFTGTALRPADGTANLSLQMQRRTARVIVNITSAGDEIDTANDKILRITVQSPYATYRNGVASDDPIGPLVAAYSDQRNIEGFNAESATRHTVLMIPAAEAKTNFEYWLDIPVEKKDGTYKHLTVRNIPAMEAGKSYTYNLKVGKDKVTIAGITVQDWNTGAVLPGGQEAEEGGWFSEELVKAMENKYSGEVTAKDINGKTLKLNFIRNVNGEIDPFDPINKALLEKIQILQVSSLGISDLRGINYLTEVTWLVVSYNELTTLDVSKLTKLNRLECDNNPKLTTVNASGLTNLTYLDCDASPKLTSLNISGATSLTNLMCYQCCLTTLDISGLTNLQSLNCVVNRLTTLDISGLTNLQTLYCGSNRLTALDLRSFTALTTFAGYSQTSDGTTPQHFDVTVASEEQMNTLKESDYSNTEANGVYFTVKSE